MFKLRVENLAPIIALLLLLPSVSSAQSTMLRQCEQIAESFFGNYEARADMQYNGWCQTDSNRSQFAAKCRNLG